MLNSNTSNRIIAMVALVATLFLMLFSSFYITEHASHHCDDSDHCPVCSMLVQCEQSLKTLGAGLIIVAVAILSVAMNTDVFSGYSYQSTQTTLITQKVRLDS